MKQIKPRTFMAISLAIIVGVFTFALYKLFSTGWIENATLTTLLFVGAIFLFCGLVLWNIVASFVNSNPKKVIKK